MTTIVVLFTRDLRVHDHPALAAACADADHVVPLFVFDDDVLHERAIASPNKVAFLLDCVEDLPSGLRDLGGALYVRPGIWPRRLLVWSPMPAQTPSTSARM